VGLSRCLRRGDCLPEKRRPTAPTGGGYLTAVDESSGPCAFPLCSRSAQLTLRLLVEEEESILAACDRHAEWLRDYVQEDGAVLVLDEMPVVPEEGSAEDDLADPA